ncbi:MAG: transporter [Pseudonocardiales bacterium]|nr:transporter [Pseudonocardiales bacterium]
MIRMVTTRAARWSAIHPWRAILLWLGFVASAIAVMSLVPTHQVKDNDSWVGQSGRATSIVHDAGLEDPPNESVLISTPSGTLDRSSATSIATELDRRIGSLKGVSSVGAPIFAHDGTAALVPITLAGDQDVADDNIAPIMDATKRIAAAHPDLNVAEVGDASMNVAVNDRVGQDLGSAEKISLPITFVIMLVAFGALIAAGIPVLLALTSVAAALGLYAPLSYIAPDPGTVANVVLLIGMAVGVDYSLFYLKREREERRRGHGTLDAVEIAAATSGHAVLVSGFAVIVAMSGLFLAGDAVFSALAVASILVVLAAVIGSLTVLPALLAKIGHWVDRPRVPLLWRVNSRIGTGGISGRVLRPVLRRPGVTAIVAIAVLFALAAPAISMKLRAANVDTLPQDIAQVQTFKRIEQSFPQKRPSLEIVVKAEAAYEPQVRSALDRLTALAGQNGNFSPADDDAIQTSADKTVSVLELRTSHDEGDPANETALKQLRSELVPATKAAGPPSAQWNVGGDVASDFDASQHLTARLPWVIAFVLALTMLMMLLMLRSWIIALLTTALNLLSVGAAFGVMTLVFQHSWFDSALNFHSTGYLVDWIPLFCFVVLVGLSMDYHVFVLSRVREGLRAGLPHRVAVEEGIRSTASVVTSAAAVMVSVFAVFAFLSMMEMKEMGVGLATAILVDATIVRLVLLPSALLLLEKRLGGLAKGGPQVQVSAMPSRLDSDHSALGSESLINAGSR